MNYDPRLMKLSADAIRVLSAEAIQRAKSGHPGMPLGCADFAFALWSRHLRFNPQNPKWLGRDRFVLSGGHASMLLYSMLHLFGFGLTMDDIKSFRQWESLTPGHPEYGHTDGVDITTGPLGSGFSSAVGMAIAQRHFVASAELAGRGLFDDCKIYVICGDGCMMEGCTQESASLAGHLKLDELIVFYDRNRVSIEGSCDLTFTEDVGARFEAMNWRVIRIADGNDFSACDAALEAAKHSDGRPTLIIGDTTIGYGAPTKAGLCKCHGEPLGEEELEGLRKNLGWTDPPFTVPAEVADFCAARASENADAAAEWERKFQAFLDADVERARKIYAILARAVPDHVRALLEKAVPYDKPVATRAASGAALQAAAQSVPSLFGGSADLGPSNKTLIKDGGDFSAENPAGRNLHFGVREQAMAFAANGMALYGTAIPYCATFFVFSDYMKPAIRLAALQHLHVIYVFTHDSFYVGEDGPTHEPVEQLTMLRAIPGLTVLRPGDAHETAQAWAYALHADGPVALLLTRQNIDVYDEETAKNVDVARGAFVVSDEKDFELALVATGSEVNLALGAADILRQEGVKVRVVSMPSQELFLAQDFEYQDKVLPFDCEAIVSIEAGSTYGWQRFVGAGGLAIGLDHFGASAPYKVLAEKFGFTPEAVAETILDFFSGDDCSCGEDDCSCGEDECRCGGGHDGKECSCGGNGCHGHK
ncbi:MAG: transketolase [Victivallaceae bacterium]|nr:transketolase [Victivallaceae bacterium]